MHYPPNPGKGDWYIYTAMSKRNCEDNELQFKYILIVLKQIGPERYRCVQKLDPGDKNFIPNFNRTIEKWKKIIDGLNSMTSIDEFSKLKLITTGKCAECDADTDADDYLCANCRGRQIS